MVVMSMSLTKKAKGIQNIDPYGGLKKRAAFDKVRW